MTAKARDTYQKVSILLAKNGFVVLIVDPIGQGERLQYAYSDNQNGLDATTRHTQLDIGSMLVGEDVVKYELWDNIRGIDYLCSRREVDAEKIGVTGHSGGGTQTMFAGAYDPRVAAAVPSCGLSERYGHFARLGPADGCYHLPNEGLRLLDNADYLIMAEDMPWLLLAAERDQYHDIDDVAFTFRESKWFYKLMSSIDRLDMYTVDSVHAFPCQSREAATWWFKRWLLNDNQPVIEPDLTIQQEKDLLVTQTGQVLTAFRNEKSIIDLNVDIANSYAKERTAYLKNLNRSDYLKMIKDASGYQEQNEPLRVQEEGVIDKKDYRVKKLVIQRENNIPLPALLCEPAKVKYPAEATIVIDSRGKNEEFGENGVITSLLKEGQMVLAVDLRGFGETRDDPGELRRGWRNWNIDHRIDQLSLHLGHPILIQRVEDAITALEYLLSLENIRDDRIRLFGIRDAGIIALHAVAFDDRIASVTVMNTVSSWLDIVKAPLAKDQLRNVVPGVLKYYDLPDLVELIQPRDVNILQPINLVSD
jgi:cephalosporin-C deacetylase-like acetyl esterase